MARTVHLRLKMDGDIIIGESSESSLDREDTIECLGFYYTTPITRVHPDVNQRVQPERELMHRLRIKKRIDRSTPLLIKAKFNNELVNEAIFQFYQPSPVGAGAEEMYYTIEASDGYVITVDQVSEDRTLAGDDAPPMLEEVEFAFRSIKWLYLNGGIVYEDMWSFE